MTEAAITYYHSSGETVTEKLSEQHPEKTVWYSIEDGDQTKNIYFFHPEDAESDVEMHVQVNPDNYNFCYPIPPGKLVVFKRQSDDQIVFTIGHLPTPHPLPIDFTSNKKGRLAIE